MKKYVDLHMHTNFSDGFKTPTEILDMVRKKNLAAFSITDHDTLDGFHAAKRLLKEGDPELVPGVELSITVEDDDVHLLAYFFNPDSAELNNALILFQEYRKKRGQLIIDKLRQLGVNIEYNDIEKQAGGAVVGRPHIAAALFENGLTKSYEEAFFKYIGNKGPAYVPKKNFSPQEALDLVHNAGGLIALAHPGQDGRDKYIEALTALGMDGLEVYHPSHSKSDCDRFRHTAERLRLLPTGGSDYHGRPDRYGAIGAMNVPASWYASMKKRVPKI